MSCAATAESHYASAVDLFSSGRLIEANAAFYLCKDAQEAAGCDAQDIATTYHNIGVIHSSLGDHEAALAILLKVLQVESTVNPLSEDMADAHVFVGATYHAVGDLLNASSHFLKALEIEECIDPSSSNCATLCGNIAETLRCQEKHEAALAMLQRKLNIEISANPDSYEAAMTYRSMGEVYTEMGKYDQALVMVFMLSLDILESHDPHSCDVAATYNAVAVIYGLQEQPDKAIEMMKLCIETYEIIDPHSVELADAYCKLGLMYQSIGNLSQAAQTFSKTLELERMVSPPHQWYPEDKAVETDSDDLLLDEEEDPFWSVPTDFMNTAGAARSADFLQLLARFNDVELVADSEIVAHEIAEAAVDYAPLVASTERREKMIRVALIRDEYFWRQNAVRFLEQAVAHLASAPVMPVPTESYSLRQFNAPLLPLFPVKPSLTPTQLSLMPIQVPHEQRRGLRSQQFPLPPRTAQYSVATDFGTGSH